MRDYIVFGFSVALLFACGFQEMPPDNSEFTVVEGDILVPANSKSSRDGFSISTDVWWARWPKGVVPYLIDKNLTNVDAVRAAIHHYHERTNVKFIPRTTQAAYIYFRPFQKAYCQSWIGYTGKAQEIWLHPVCDKRSVIHEIGHAIGLWHEHTRSDRDKYIKVHPENILAGLESNVAKRATYGLMIGPYDFGSIMHYRPWELSKNGKPTITKLDGSTDGLSNPNGLSVGDIASIKKLYP